jgi:hypothetical protein
MLPPAAALFESEPVAGLVVLGLWPEDNLQVACIDMAGGISGTPWEPRVESHTVLPSFSAEQQARSMGLAPSNHQYWWTAMPPVQTVGAIQPFPALKRLAWSLTASLPGVRHDTH